MKQALMGILAATAVLPPPAVAARQQGTPPSSAAAEAKSQPQQNVRVSEREVSAADVATTPVSDLNLKRDEIPALLIAAGEKPYDLAGLRRCPAIAGAIGDLDALLGPDVDLQQDNAERLSAGKVAQSVVGSFIPFRSVIREISGANEQQRKLRLAIEAGIARRSFLKGYGEARGCRYPARSASAGLIAEHRANVAAASAQAKEAAASDKATGKR